MFDVGPSSSDFFDRAETTVFRLKPVLRTVVAIAQTVTKGIKHSMDWWRYKPTLRYRVDRTAGAVFAVFSCYWLLSWLTSPFPDFRLLVIALANSSFSAVLFIRSFWGANKNKLTK